MEMTMATIGRLTKNLDTAYAPPDGAAGAAVDAGAGARREAQRWVSANVAGTTKTAMNVAASMPPNTVVPRTRREAAPDPVAMHRGTTPRMNARAVMRIGRRRSRAPASAASVIEAPR